MEIAVNADFSSLPTGLQIGIAALTVLEFVLLLLAVVVNLKTPESRLTLPPRRVAGDFDSHRCHRAPCFPLGRPSQGAAARDNGRRKQGHRSHRD